MNKKKPNNQHIKQEHNIYQTRCNTKSLEGSCSYWCIQQEHGVAFVLP